MEARSQAGSPRPLRTAEPARLPRRARRAGGSASHNHTLPSIPRPAAHTSNLPLPCSAASVDAVAANTTTAAGPEAEAWAGFAAAVSGEWDGVTVTFDTDGQPQQLPDYYVPQAYRDWDVKIHDWQSQCSMLAGAEGVRYSLRRLMPTVGCEADAIAFVEEQQQVLSAQQAAPSTVTADGAYSAGPGDLSRPDLSQAAAEHCLPLAADQRLRVVHSMKRMGAQQRWRLVEIELHREQRDGAYTGRRELAGCGGGMDLFSQQPALQRAALEGTWVASGVRFEADGSGNMVRNEVEQQLWSAAGSSSELVLLPLAVWSSVTLHGEDADLAAGCILEDGSMRVSRRQLTSGRLQMAELLVARRE